MPQLAVVHTFWTDYEQLEKPVRAGVRKAITKFQSLTVAELYADKGLGLSVARMARDPRMRTIRITAFWRGVLLAPDDGSETFLLLKVLPHDEALQWAATRLVSVNSAMGSLEVRDVAAMERLVTSRPASHAPTTLFARFSVTDLTVLGIDGQTLEAIRTITDRAQFDAFQPLLPEDQREVLQYLAEGFDPAEVFQNVVAPRRPADANPCGFGEPRGCHRSHERPDHPFLGSWGTGGDRWQAAGRATNRRAAHPLQTGRAQGLRV